MFYRFYYRGIFKIDIYQEDWDSAINELSSRDILFGINPLDFDDFDFIDSNSDDFWR